MKMKVFLIVIAVALVLAVSAAPGASEESKPAQIPWVSSFDTALQLAKQQDKPILLDFYNPK